ncbi:MAG: 2-oxoacid:acceptor oxidoreductase family protein [Deltaproteobacteria bacterium]|nr:2-oxoacid:acceptor oxidoreductase family protein [Deltaproteobacteria bacterium]
MSRPRLVRLPEHIVEIVSDAGEGAQKAAIAFAQLCAKTGNGLWTVEIIPSEIRPPPHTIGSASGNRIRLAARSQVTLLSRLEAGSLADDVLVLIDDQWATHDVEEYRLSYREVLDTFRARGATIIEIPLQEETLRHVEDAEQGKNMFAVGVLCALYNKNVNLLQNVIRGIFEKKTREVIETAVKLAAAGYQYGITHLEERFEIQAVPTDVPKVAMNGNTALALGAVSAGFEMCSMYPITPATSASHELSEIFEEFGGFVHQAEDEIAAIGVALGASYAGKTALTITSGPGMAWPEHRVADEGRASGSASCALWCSRRRTQGGDGAEHDRGVLLHSFRCTEDRGGIPHARHRPFRRQPCDRSTAFRSSRCLRNTAAASARPQPGVTGSPTLRLESNDGPFAASHPRAAGRNGGDDFAQPRRPWKGLLRLRE